MSATSFTPKFIKAKITFQFEDELKPKIYEAGEQLVNLSGVPGFQWTEFAPMEYIGRKIKAKLEVVGSKPTTIFCIAFLSAEITEYSVSLGMTLKLSPEQSILVNDLVALEGTLPDYVRKFPRIAYSEAVGVMPAHTIVSFQSGAGPLVLVCTVDNLSPTGLQVFTEDPRIISVGAGDEIIVEIEPRGSFDRRITMKTQVKRVIHTINPTSGNNRWYFGLSVVTLANESKAAFTDLLRLILGSLTKR